MSRYADFSGARPGGRALKAAGFTGVIRYVGIGSSGKRITAAEYQDYVANEVDVLLVAEQGTDDAWVSADDRAAGRSHAQAALNDARNLGIPDWVPIAAAADSHATAAQLKDATAYTEGFEDILGRARTGIYGFVETVTAVHNAGVAGWFWLCGSKPPASIQSWTNFWQDNTQKQTVNGTGCDINWTYAPLGEDMPLTQADATLVVQTLLQDPNFQMVVARIAELSTGAATTGDASSYAPTKDEPNWLLGTLNTVSSTVSALAAKPDPVITLDPASLDSVRQSVVSAVTSLPITVSDTDKQAIADATATELAKRLESA